jgi:hypothetical protein
MTKALYAQITARERELYARFQELVQTSDLDATGECWDAWLCSWDKYVELVIGRTIV